MCRKKTGRKVFNPLKGGKKRIYNTRNKVFDMQLFCGSCLEEKHRVENVALAFWPHLRSKMMIIGFRLYQLMLVATFSYREEMNGLSSRVEK